MKKIYCLLGIILIGPYFLGCQKSSTIPTVTIAIWSRYLPDDFVEQFQKKTGIQPIITTFSSNEEVLAKLQAGFTGYDVIVPTDYMVSIMSQLGLLRKLDLSKIFNYSQISSRFLKQPFDPKNEYSVPCVSSSTGIGINRAFFKKPILAWKDLVVYQKELIHKISLLDDAREVIGAALIAQGDSVNTTKSDALEKAKSWLLSFRKSVKVFTSEPVVPLSTGEVWVSQIFASDALFCKYVLKKDIEYVYPSEGYSISIDNLVITQSSKNQEAAYAFINYFLNPEMSVHLAQKVFLSPVFPDVFNKMTPEFQNLMAIFPSEDIVKNAQGIVDVGQSTVLFDRIWTEIKSISG